MIWNRIVSLYKRRRKLKSHQRLVGKLESNLSNIIHNFEEESKKIDPTEEYNNVIIDMFEDECRKKIDILKKEFSKFEN